MKNKILILCGKSGSGKDFIQRQLIKNENFKQIVFRDVVQIAQSFAVRNEKCVNLFIIKTRVADYCLRPWHSIHDYPGGYFREY